MKKTKKFRPQSHKYKRPLVFGIGFAIAGTALLIATRAATQVNFTIDGTSNGIRNATATIITDGGAHGSDAILLRGCAQGLTGTPPNCTVPPVNTTFNENFNTGTPNFISPTGSGPHGALAGPAYINGRAYPNQSLVDANANANITYGADHFSEATLHTGNALTDYIGITVRADISDPSYYWYKFEMFPGGSMRIASLFHDPSVPNHGFGECGSNYRLQANTQYRIRLEIRGQTLIGYVNGTPVMQCRDTTHRQITSGGTPGIILWGTNSSLDDFTAGSLSGIPAPANLPALQQLTLTLDN